VKLILTEHHSFFAMFALTVQSIFCFTAPLGVGSDGATIFFHSVGGCSNGATVFIIIKYVEPHRAFNSL
jgi:hypothetical protein